MSSLERVQKACRHDITDRAPVGPFAGFYAARLTGVNLRQYVTDGEAIAKAQLALQQATGQDIVVTAADTYYLAEGFGLEVELHDDALPTAKGPLLSELSEVNQLRVPDPHRDGRMPVYLKAVEVLAREAGERIAIRGTGTGPLSLAAYLYGMQRLLLTLALIETGEASPEDERQVQQLIGIAAEAGAAFLKAQLEAGAHLIYLGDSLASCDVLSPAMYRKYVHPHLTRIFAELNPLCRERGAFTLLHICGNNTLILDDLVKTGADILEIDHKMELGMCKERIDRKVCLIGNLDPAGTILRGTPEEVRRESRRCLEQAGRGGGFILGTGCFVPADSPVENLRAMVEASKAIPSM
jgi:uroporphyrinogen decarboxylase